MSFFCSPVPASQAFFVPVEYGYLTQEWPKPPSFILCLDGTQGGSRYLAHPELESDPGYPLVPPSNPARNPDPGTQHTPRVTFTWPVLYSGTSFSLLLSSLVMQFQGGGKMASYNPGPSTLCAGLYLGVL